MPRAKKGKADVQCCCFVLKTIFLAASIPASIYYCPYYMYQAENHLLQAETHMEAQRAEYAHRVLSGVSASDVQHDDLVRIACERVILTKQMVLV